MNYPQYISRFIISTIFPIKCLECGQFSLQKHPKYICKKCFRGIDIKKKFECIGCNNPSQLGKTCFRCKDTNSIDQILSASDYDNPLVVKLIKTYKYRFVSDIAEPLSLITKKYIFWLSKYKKLNIIEEDPIIIPVPLHYRRLNWRGFNQTELIAKFLADNLYSSYESNLIIRIIETKPQAELEEKEERLKNIGNIFKVTAPEKIRNRTILLVDDICTTGTTLNQCANILKKNGARKVIGFVVARG